MIAHHFDDPEMCFDDMFDLDHDDFCGLDDPCTSMHANQAIALEMISASESCCASSSGTARVDSC